MRKGNKLSLIKRILLSPITILGMAPKLYSKSMMVLAGKIGCGAGPEGAMSYNLSDLPRSYTIGSCRMSMNEEEYKAILMPLERKKGETYFHLAITRGASGMGIKSYSVGLGKIDEETPCSFRENDVVLKSSCKSNALTIYKQK